MGFLQVKLQNMNVVTLILNQWLLIIETTFALDWTQKDLHGLGGGITFADDICRQYETCDTCLGDPKCGWCKDYDLCIVGNSTGPDEGSCDWYYYYCPGNNTQSPNTTMFFTTPSQSRRNWLTYGGDSVHSGYVEYYEEKITSSSNAIKYYSINIDVNSDYYMTSVAAADGILYFNEFNIKNYTVNQNGHSIEDRKSLWRISIGSDNNEEAGGVYNYASGPTVSSDNKYVLFLAADTEKSTIAPYMLNIENEEQFQLDC